MKNVEEFLQKAKDRWKLAVDAHEEQYERGKEDAEFTDPANQWPDNIKSMRGEKPCLVVDVLTPILKQIVNEQRQNRPAVKVSPVDSQADVKTAEVLQGIVRHIEYNSDADVAYDRACESQVRSGLGFIRVSTAYSDPMSMDQDIQILSVPNPFMVQLDPSSIAPDGSDAQWAFVAEDFTKEDYQAAFPDSQLAGMSSGDWKGIADESPEWMSGQSSACRVVEYFEKTFKKATLYKLEDGSVVTELPEGATAVESRETQLSIVKWYKLNAIEILEETEWGCEWIPLIPVYGDELIIDGKKKYFGLVHRAKDIQKMVNVWKSVQTEVIGLSSKAPWLASVESMAGHEDTWATANIRDWNALPWNAYDESGRQLPPPSRDMQEPAIQAITMALQGSMQDIKAVTGMYDPNLGIRDSSSQSGVAIRNLQHQGQVGNFHFQDNLARSIRHLGRMLVALIRKLYDTPRITRTIGVDESNKMVMVNGQPGDALPEGQDQHFDLQTGKYDVTCSVGPSYTSKRQENLALLLDFSKNMPPQQAALITDLVASQLDAPIAEEIARRLKLTLPPELQDKQDGAPDIPPQIQAQMAQAQQQTQALMQQHEQLTQALHQVKDQLDDQNAKIQADMAKAQLDAQTKLQIARMGNETELIKLQATLDAKSANDQLLAQLADLQGTHGELQQLVLHLHDAMVHPRETPEQEAEEPVQEAPQVEAAEPKPDPMHLMMQGHTAALQGIAEALKRSGAPKKRTLQMDAKGRPVGILEEEAD